MPKSLRRNQTSRSARRRVEHRQVTPDAAAAEHRRERLLCSRRDPNCEAEVVIELLRSERVSTCASSSARSSPERGSGARDDPRAARRPPRRRARLAGAHRRRDHARRVAKLTFAAVVGLALLLAAVLWRGTKAPLTRVRRVPSVITGQIYETRGAASQLRR
jgi:hypothetical protein